MLHGLKLSFKMLCLSNSDSQGEKEFARSFLILLPKKVCGLGISPLLQTYYKVSSVTA